MAVAVAVAVEGADVLLRDSVPQVADVLVAAVHLDGAVERVQSCCEKLIRRMLISFLVG